jgi:hypothetical protein
MSLNVTRGRMSGIVRCAVIVAAAAALTSSAFAQGGRGGGGGGQPGGGGGRQEGRGGGPRGGGFGGFGGMGDMMNAPVNSREIDRYGQMLKLSADQKTVVKELFDGLQEDFRGRADAVQEQIDKAREQARDGDNSGFMAMRDTMTKFREERATLEKTFLQDFQAVLTPEQQALWPKVERVRRRDTTINRGLMAGERVNLFEIVEESKLPSDVMTQVTPILDQYEVDLDRVLIERNKVQEEGIATFTRGGFGRQGEPPDMEKMQKAFNEGREASVKVRDTNRRYAKQIEGVLPEERKAAFDAAVKEASFPDVYRPSQVTRQITSVSGFADITADQKQQLSDLKEQYARESSPLADKLATAQEEQQMKMSAQDMMQMFRGEQEGPVADLRRQRRELDRAFGEKLKAILTPEQVERLPQQDDRGGGPGGGNGGQGGNRGDRAERRRT